MKKTGNSTANNRLEDRHDSVEKSKETIIVGVGASAGGLEALQEFFSNVPENCGLAFVVVQHLSPDYKSLMDELLARHTKIPIQIAEESMEVQPNNIYLIPPRKNISIFHNKLFLDTQNNKKSLNLPVDVFFRSLAVEKGKNAIGIVLSGTGSDGTLGTRAIKEAGGMIMAQDETTAKFDGMPRNCIATGLVDFILPPAAMPEALVNYTKHPFTQANKTNENILTKNIDALTKVVLILRDHCGIDFSYYKENTLVRRLERRVSINRFDTLEDYLKFLNESNKEKETLYRELLIGVTRFFRDTEAFARIKEKVIPNIDFKSKKPIRIWSVGCSTGEEVYSLAILFQEYLDQNELDCDIKFFATDVDKYALEQASTGFYPESIVADVDPMYLTKYFNKRENGFQINDAIRKNIVFATHNLLKDPPFSKLDLLICRNLFIYIKPEMQHRILSFLHYSLSPKGFLFLGSSETLGAMSDGFDIIDAKWKIYKVKASYKPTLGKALPTPLYVSKSKSPVQLSNPQDLGTVKFEHLADNLLTTLAPPSIIIDEHDNIVHIVNNVNKFISFRPGKFSHNVFSHLHKNLQQIVRTQLHKLKKEKKATLLETIFEAEEGIRLRVVIEGKLLTISNEIFYIISFREESEEEAHQHTSNNALLLEQVEKESIRYIELQKELQYTKESLQATVEELETSNEELQSSNEELIAANEELQSTNEELQSVNEELFTVNSEYQSKIEELTKINNDINNLLKNTEVGALYLDSKLCIRKITPLVASITNILPSDTGRPIAHISVVNVYPEMIEDINYVTETLQPIEREFIANNGKSYLVRTLPYRTENNAIEGILLTFVDISKLKVEKQNLELTSKRLQDAMEMGQLAWWEWDYATGKVKMDARKATMIGYTLEEFPDDVYKICELIHPDDFENTMQIMRDHLMGKTPEWIAHYRIKRKDGGYAWYYDRGAITERTKDGKPLKLMGTVFDISILKNMETERRSIENILQKTLDALPIEQAQIICDINGVVLYASAAVAAYLGVSTESLKSTNILSDSWKWLNAKKSQVNAKDHPFTKAKSTLKPYSNAKIFLTIFGKEPKLCNIEVTPFVDQNHKRFEGVSITLR
ncbi:MAG TPA: chemotaxis protein CheR [Chitinophagaceae bacterium]|nr:chemotaxis protein CheR [Chitinophagaceae bacterium]